MHATSQVEKGRYPYTLNTSAIAKSRVADHCTVLPTSLIDLNSVPHALAILSAQ